MNNLRTGTDAPAPHCPPLVGHAPAFLRDKLGFLSRCAATYGDVVRLDIGGRTYLVSGPEDVKHVLVSNAANYEKTPRLTGVQGRRFFGDGLVTARGQAHLRQRHMLQPLFHRNALDRLAGIIVGCAGELTAPLKNGDVVDVHQAMLDVTQRITLRSLFGEETESEINRLRDAVTVRRRYQEFLLGSILPFADHIPTPLRSRHLHAEREIATIVLAAVGRRRGGGAPAPDVLSKLARATYEDGSSMDDRQILDEVRTFLIAGYETVAEALTWTWYLLARHSSAELAVAAEVCPIPGDRLQQAPHAVSLPWCRMVVAEAMRLYPPTWLFVRVAEQDDVLPTGTRIPAGSKIYLSQWVMHRNPRFFPDPERFDPSRFAEAAIKARPRFTYVPFGAGRRLCIGEEFAWMQATLILASMARRLRLVLDHRLTVVPEPDVTLRPRGGLRMEVALR